MTGLRSSLGKLFGGQSIEIPGAPQADLVVAPDTVEQVCRLLDFASEHGLVVLPWGSGGHQGYGGRIEPDIVLSSAGFGDVTEWNPDDLTIVVGSGATVGEVATTIESRTQSAVLPEWSPAATVGGVIASGVSGWRRLRYGPTRDRVLQVEFVTGDGRFVTGGARLVKNVTGFDLPRLLTGSFGSLGFLTGVCLKLWPEPETRATVVTDDPERVLAVTYRPNAVLQVADRVSVYLAGSAAEVEAQASAVGGQVTDGFEWPRYPAGDCVINVRVPPAGVAPALAELGDVEFVAAHGVGEVVAAVDVTAIPRLRAWAEERRGVVVVERAPDAVYSAHDPWGTPPGSSGLQRKIKAAFDPLDVMVPGRMPAGL